MRYSQFMIPTLKEIPSDAQVISHILMLRAGMIRKLAAGIYIYLPLGLRSIRKMEQIVREEMNRAGAQELLMPMVQPAEIWQQSGRWHKYGPELLRLKDRKGGEFCLGPTHEEVITYLFANEIKSYRQLPINLYQIQDKFRDEIRPRFGLMRGREFLMKDAYSFHTTEEDCHREYKVMYDAYTRIFKRAGLNFRAVEADTGAIGGSRSHEFQVLAQSGEDLILSCDQCSYSANVEMAETAAPPEEARTVKAAKAEMEPLREVETPDQRTIEEVSVFLKAAPADLCKTLIYFDDQGRFYAVCIRGDCDVNEMKLRRALGVTAVYLAEDADIEKLTGAPTGFAGPVGLKIPVVADTTVKAMRNFITGANKKDVHLVGVNLERDVTIERFADIRLAQEGEVCPRCGTGRYKAYRGIEVGQVFYLGRKYSEPMGANVLGPNGEPIVCTMGCYGIGVTRSVAAAIEQNHDDDGIVWPAPLAPFEVHLVPLLMQGEAVVEATEKIYAELTSRGVETLMDDRDERAGVKFKDADLLGLPIRITIGKKALEQGAVEFKLRREAKVELVPLDKLLAKVKDTLRALYDECKP
ncbi:MAG: proline--tRNA ligase [Myxococcales bacterium]|nr:MAG: proline--tRNA ligase [Myxococcales bacterium]